MPSFHYSVAVSPFRCAVLQFPCTVAVVPFRSNRCRCAWARNWWKRLSVDVDADDGVWTTAKRQRQNGNGMVETRGNRLSG